MHIFVDESGTFTGIGGALKPSVVGALVIPEASADALFADYARLRLKLPTDKGEVKGKQLSAAHLRTVTDFLARYPVLFDATAIDPGMHTAVGIEARGRRGGKGGKKEEEGGREERRGGGEGKTAITPLSSPTACGVRLLEISRPQVGQVSRD